MTAVRRLVSIVLWTLYMRVVCGEGVFVPGHPELRQESRAYDSIASLDVSGLLGLVEGCWVGWLLVVIISTP